MSEIDEAASDPLGLLMRVRQAFRTLNRLYVQERDGIAAKRQREAKKRPQERRGRAA